MSSIKVFQGVNATHTLHHRFPFDFRERDRRTKLGKQLHRWDTALGTLDDVALELDVPLSYLLPIDADQLEHKPEQTVSGWARENHYMLNRWVAQVKEKQENDK